MRPVGKASERYQYAYIYKDSGIPIFRMFLHWGIHLI